MKIAMVASEAAPFAKTGGLADVAGALPKALFRLGHEPILIMPLYRAVRAAGVPMTEVARIRVPVWYKHVDARVFQADLPGTRSCVYFLDQDAYFDRPGLYNEHNIDYRDNCERFAFLSRGAMEAMKALSFRPDVIHAHDWQTALIAPYLRLLYNDDPFFEGAASFLTIHNLLHQGIFWHWDMNVIGIDWRHFNPREFEFWGNINLLKAGIVYADVVNTVSPTYAQEMRTPEHGHGLDGVLRDRGDTVHGVVNGIDTAVWNPAGDNLVPARYGPEDLRGKATCKRSLQRHCGLPVRRTPFLGIVSRFAHQKGLDLAAEALRELFATEVLQCAVLGDGEHSIRNMLEELAGEFPENLCVVVGHDEQMAHRVIAGADMLLVPSRFEPCGLTQLYGLKYGSIPVVRETGGLKDTVCDCTPATLAAGKATGFTFKDPTPKALADCLRRALELCRDQKSWDRLTQIGMAQDWSWEASAQRYLQLYAEARQKRGVI